MAKTKAARKRQNAIVRILHETVAELRKVTWPSRQEAINLTILVLVVVLISSSLLGLLDYLFARLMGMIISL